MADDLRMALAEVLRKAGVEEADFLREGVQSANRIALFGRSGAQHPVQRRRAVEPATQPIPFGVFNPPRRQRRCAGSIAYEPGFTPKLTVRGVHGRSESDANHRSQRAA
jgi:hypothetical protein